VLTGVGIFITMLKSPSVIVMSTQLVYVCYLAQSSISLIHKEIDPYHSLAVVGRHMMYHRSWQIVTIYVSEQLETDKFE